MEKSCDKFWKWGRACKKMAFSKVSSPEGGFCSMSDKASSVADGFSLKIPRKGGPWQIRHCMDVASIPRSHKIVQVSSSKFGSACSDLGLPFESSSVEVNLFNNEYKYSEVNSINSPISVVQPSTSDADTMSCNPHDDLRCFSGEKFFEGGIFCEREESAKLRAKRMNQRGGIRMSGTSCKRTSFTDDSLYCPISEDEKEGRQLQNWILDEETGNLKSVSISEATSNYMDMDESCKKLKPCHSPISSRDHEIQKENSEAFAALEVLADVAVWILENGDNGEDKSKISRGQWRMFHQSSHQNVMKRIKGDSNSLPPELSAHAHKFLPSLTKHLFASELSSPESSLKREHDREINEGLGDKNGENLNVRRSKRSRSQYLNSKYPNSVLEPLKKGR